MAKPPNRIGPVDTRPIHVAGGVEAIKFMKYAGAGLIHICGGICISGACYSCRHSKVYWCPITRLPPCCIAPNRRQRIAFFVFENNIAISCTHIEVYAAPTQPIHGPCPDRPVVSTVFVERILKEIVFWRHTGRSMSSGRNLS